MTLPTFLELRRFHVRYDCVVGFLSYVLNFLVIYLAVYKSNQALREYRVIIIWSACVDLIFNTTNSLTMELCDFAYGKLFLANSGLLEHLPQPFARATGIFWLFTLYLMLINVPLTFFFRYRVLCCQKKNYLSEYAKIYGVCVFLIALLTASGFLHFQTNEEYPEYTVELKANGLFAEETPPFMIMNALTLKGGVFLGLVDLMVIISYVVVFWTGTRIHRMLKTSRPHMSPAILAVQRQITIILILQAVSPFFMVAFPIFLGGGLPLLGIKSPGLGLWLIMLLTALPLVNAMTVIFVVPSFRRTILMCSRRSSTVNSSVPCDISA